MSDFNLKVGAKVDTSTIQKQLNATKKEVVVTIVTKGGTEYQKTVTKMATESGKLYEVTDMLNKKTGETKTTVTKLRESFKEIKEDIKTARTEVTKFTDASGKMTTSTTRFNEAGEQLGATTVRVSENIKEATKDMKVVDTYTNKYTDSTGKLVTETKRFNSSGEQVGETTRKITTEMQKASKHTKTLGEDFLITAGKVAKFGAITSLIGLFTKSMYEAVESVKVMDDSLTELKKVTDLSGSGLENYTDQAFAMARDLKTTASDVTDAVTEFAKSNYTLEESQVLAKQAIIFQTIADGAVSASDSATMLIQVMKAYDMTVSDSVKIVDSINEVDILAFLFGNI